MVEALAGGGAADGAAIRRLIEAPPGLESAERSQVSDELRRERIIWELKGRTEARDTSSRSHRRAALNGGMGFVELARLMNVGWKECDDFARGVFRELADEGRERYRRVLLDYNNRVERLGLAEEDPRGTKNDDVEKETRATPLEGGFQGGPADPVGRGPTKQHGAPRRLRMRANDQPFPAGAASNGVRASVPNPSARQDGVADPLDRARRGPPRPREDAARQGHRGAARRAEAAAVPTGDRVRGGEAEGRGGAAPDGARRRDAAQGARRHRGRRRIASRRVRSRLRSAGLGSTQLPGPKLLRSTRLMAKINL